jgi:LPPG:FO 2-phospho-L-lactate transferase
MSDEPVRTRICTASGELEFQTYFVRRRARDTVAGVRFEGASEARPTPGVLEAIEEAEAVIVCPSNPFISVEPILAIPGIREALQRKREVTAAISPIVGGRALKGPAGHMMKSLKKRAAAAVVAELYADFAGIFVLDEVDHTQAAEVEELGLRAVVTNTIMSGRRERKALARAVASALEIA